jgi:hypothetical protein
MPLSCVVLTGRRGMKIVARIEKIGCDLYMFDGKTFDSFVSARREMVQRVRLRRTARQTRTSRVTLSRAHMAGA